MVFSTSSAFSLTAHNTASGHYTLGVMTVVAAILLPFVLAYLAWTYYVFRRRVSRSEFQPAPQPGEVPGPREPAATSDAAPPQARRRT